MTKISSAIKKQLVLKDAGRLVNISKPAEAQTELIQTISIQMITGSAKRRLNTNSTNFQHCM